MPRGPRPALLRGRRSIDSRSIDWHSECGGANEPLRYSLCEDRRLHRVIVSAAGIAARGKYGQHWRQGESAQPVGQGLSFFKMGGAPGAKRSVPLTELTLGLRLGSVPGARARAFDATSLAFPRSRFGLASGVRNPG